MSVVTPTKEGSGDQDLVVGSPGVQFEPIVSLPLVERQTLEEDEEILLKIRTKLFRWVDEDGGDAQWKERGVGDIKILKHKESNKIRLLMRRDKTHKLCCNHYITKEMELTPNVGSDRAWVWTTFADLAEDEPRRELLAARFSNTDNAKIFKEHFDRALEEVKELDTSIGENEPKSTENDCKASAGVNEDKKQNDDDKEYKEKDGAADDKNSPAAAATNEATPSTTGDHCESSGLVTDLKKLAVAEAEESRAEKVATDDGQTKKADKPTVGKR